eukprot:6259660-Alexandrium_andersonii.AAC.1
MDEATVPAGPTGRNILIQCSNSAESRSPDVSALRTEVAALRAASPAPGAAFERGPRFLPIPSPGQGRFAPLGRLGPQHHPYGMWAPSQF